MSLGLDTFFGTLFALREGTMNVAAYKGASALTAYEQWQQSVAQNLAYAAVTGYRRDQVAFSGLMAETLKLKNGDETKKSIKGVMPESKSNLDSTPAPVHYTGVETDFAIDGQGFFRVRKPDGTQAYTRAGNFYINADRALVTAQGHLVDGENGPIQFQQQGGAIYINGIGMIVQGSQPIARIGVFRFADPSQLRRIGDSLLAPPAGVAPTPVENAALIHMNLEESNVRPMKEAIDMLMVGRAYEASRKVIDTSDENAGKAIQYLGNV
jgi:flagellar basal body rod protein FlgG